MADAHLKPIGMGGDGTPAFDDKRPASEPFDNRVFVDSGLLWALNRLVLHPRGFALSWDDTEQTWQLFGDGTECWAFEHDTDVSRQAVYETTLRTLTEAYAAKRALAIADELTRLRDLLERCACGVDNPDDVCLVHSPVVQEQAAELLRLRHALREIHAQAEVARDLDEFVAFVLHLARESNRR